MSTTTSHKVKKRTMIINLYVYRHVYGLMSKARKPFLKFRVNNGKQHICN